MNIVYCFNENYLSLAAVSIVSLCENNKYYNEVIIYTICFGVPAEKMKMLSELVNKYDRRLIIINGEGLFENIRLWSKARDAQYARIFISELINEDKVIYLDCDTIIMSSLQELWETNISSHFLAAVRQTAHDEIKCEAGLSINDDYFNSGVMLINLKLWRHEDLTKKMMNFKKSIGKKGYCQDQRVLNAICNSRVIWLKSQYNLFLAAQRASDDESENVDSPIIIHYCATSAYNPWVEPCLNPYVEICRKYGKMTIMAPDIIKCSKSIIWKERLKRMLPYKCYKVLIWMRSKYRYLFEFQKRSFNLNRIQ